MCECCLNCFLSILFATCSGGQRVCAYVCACPGLYEEWGQWEALAAQAPPSVSLPPLASCALAEVVARRQTAKRQIAMPRETRNIVSYVQTTPGQWGGGWRNRQKQPEGPTDRQTQSPAHTGCSADTLPGAGARTLSDTHGPTRHRRTHTLAHDLPPSPLF